MSAPAPSSIAPAVASLFATPSLRAQTLGPFFVGLVLDAAFLGLLLALAISYYTRHTQELATSSKHLTIEGFLATEPGPAGAIPPGSMGQANVRAGDGWFTKGIVFVAVTVNVAITLVIWRWNFDLFVYNFGVVERIFTQKYQASIYVLDTIGMAVVQAFYLFKAYALSSRKVMVVGGVGLLLHAELGTGIALTIKYSQMGSLLEADQQSVVITQYIWMISTLLTNVFITGLLVLFLFWSRTGWSRTDKITSKLMRVVFESQLLPALLALGLVIQYTVNKDSFYNIPFLCCQAKIYAIGLLYTLISRTSIRRDVQATTGVSKLESKTQQIVPEIFPLSKTHFVEPAPDKVHVQVDTLVYTDVDTTYHPDSKSHGLRSPQFRDTQGSIHKEYASYAGAGGHVVLDEDDEDAESTASVTLNGTMGSNGYASDTRLNKVHGPEH